MLQKERKIKIIPTDSKTRPKIKQLLIQYGKILNSVEHEMTTKKTCQISLSNIHISLMLDSHYK